MAIRAILGLTLATLVAGCTAQQSQPTVQVPEASMAEYRLRLASLPAGDPMYQGILDRLQDRARTPQTVETDRILASAYLTRGQAFNRQTPPNTKGAAADFRQILDLFSNSTDPEVALTTARALTELGLLRPRLADVGDAIAERRALYAQALTRLQNLKSDQADEVTARVLYLQGMSLLQDRPMQRTEGLAVLDDLANRFRANPSSSIHRQVVSGRIDAAQSLAGQAPFEYATAVSLAEDALSLLKDRSVPDRDFLVSSALLQKGYSLYRLGKETEALAIADQILKDFGKAADGPTRRVVSRVALNLVYTHRDAIPRRTDAQRLAIRDMVARFGSDTDNLIVERVAEALGLEGDSLSDATPPRYEDALDSYMAAHRRLGNLTATYAIGTRHEVAVDLGRTYAQLKRKDEALKYLDLSDKLAVSAPSDQRVSLQTRSLSQRVVSLTALGGNPLPQVSDIMEKLAKVTEGTISPQVAFQHLLAHERHISLLTSGPSADWGTALTAIDELIKRYNTLDDRVVEENIAWLQFNRGLALKKLGRSNEALAVWSEMVPRFASPKATNTAYAVALALSEKATILEEKQPAEARQALETILRQFETSPASRMPALLQTVRQRLKRLNQPVTG